MTKIEVNNYYKGGKSVTVIAGQSALFHSIATILKNKNEVKEAFKESASLEAMRLNKILRRAYGRHGEISNDLDGLKTRHGSISLPAP